MNLRLLFMGRKKSAANMLKWTVKQNINVMAVVTDCDIVNSHVEYVAKKMKIPVISLKEAEEQIRKNSEWINLAVSYLFGQKLKSPIIDKPAYGCINFHPAILPQYRGLGGYNIAILNKIRQWGASAHYVENAIDMGPIIDVFKFDFDYQLETALSLENKTLKIQEELYKSVLNRVRKLGKLDAQLQLQEQGIYINRKKMLDLMKLDCEQDDIDLKIQACWFPPYHGAYIDLQGKKYTLVNEFILKQIADLVAKNEGGFED